MNAKETRQKMDTFMNREDVKDTMEVLT